MFDRRICVPAKFSSGSDGSRVARGRIAGPNNYKNGRGEMSSGSSDRFSGHESFVCRYGWLPKVFRAVKKEPNRLRSLTLLAGQASSRLASPARA